MTSRKRNEWLDADESEEDDRGYDSEDQGRAKLLTKRRKLSHSPDPDSENEASQSDYEAAEPPKGKAKKETTTSKEQASAEKKAELEYDDVEARLPPVANSLLDSSALHPHRKPLDLVTTQSKTSKSGVIYISRVPPFMKPSVVRRLLEPYGSIGRIFLTPEDPTHRQSRVKSGGSRRKLFLDGWVEFLSKKDAKFVAENLNAQTIGGKKRSRFHDEVWNIKYLKGLKWHHLVEQIANENAERAARMRAEISQSTRENRMFLENVERAKMLEGMQAKRERKEGADGERDRGGDAAGDESIKPTTKRRKVVESLEEGQGPRRVFKQNEVLHKAARDAKPSKDEGVQRVLSKIF